MKNLITLSAPSGSGKTTLCKALQRVNTKIKWSISYTSREKRTIETDGIDYKFISSDEFENLILKQELAEWENVHGFYYGTPKASLENAINNKKTM